MILTVFSGKGHYKKKLEPPTATLRTDDKTT